MTAVLLLLYRPQMVHVVFVDRLKHPDTLHAGKVSIRIVASVEFAVHCLPARPDAELENQHRENGAEDPESRPPL